MAVDFSSLTNWLTARNGGVPPVYAPWTPYTINHNGWNFEGKMIGAFDHSVGFNMSNPIVQEACDNFINNMG